MTPSDLDARARALYDDCSTVKPDWSQLGEPTRGVWREMASARIAPAEPAKVSVRFFAVLHAESATLWKSGEARPGGAEGLMVSPDGGHECQIALF